MNQDLFAFINFLLVFLISYLRDINPHYGYLELFMRYREKLLFLVVEDTVSDSFLFQKLIRQISDKAEVHFVDTLLSLRYALKNFIPDFIISDYNLDDFTAFDVIEEVKNHNSGLPVYVISGMSNVDLKRDELLAKGARDFFHKDFVNELPTKFVPEVCKDLESSPEFFAMQRLQRERLSKYKETTSFFRHHGEMSKDQPTNIFKSWMSRLFKLRKNVAKQI